MAEFQGVQRGSASDGHAASGAAKTESDPRVLAVGDVAPEALQVCDPLTIMAVAFEELNPGFVAEWQPTLVLSPLVGLGYDCVDLAQVLVSAGFTGRYRAAVADLPNPAVVRREITSHFPDLDFDVLIVGRPETPPPAQSQ